MVIFKGSVIDETNLKRSPEEIKDLLRELEKGGNASDRKHPFVFPNEAFLQEKQHTSEPPYFVLHDKKSVISLPSPHILEKKLELLKSLETLQIFFNDPIERYIQYFRFKEELKALRDTVDPKHWDLLRLIVGCMDAVTNTESEDLNLSQVETFRRVVKEIEEDIDCATVNSLLGALISTGLKPIPPLKNLEPVEE